MVDSISWVNIFKKLKKKKKTMTCINNMGIIICKFRSNILPFCPLVKHLYSVGCLMKSSHQYIPVATWVTHQHKICNLVPQKLKKCYITDHRLAYIVRTIWTSKRSDLDFRMSIYGVEVNTNQIGIISI